MMMLKDNTGTDDTKTTPPTPKGNINWLSQWLSDTDHDIPLKCVWCEERFLADTKLQAEIRTQSISFGVMSAETTLVERYMEWHINGHPEDEST